MKRIFLLLLLFCSTSAALAEKADATQPINVEANQMAFDDIKQVNVFTGDVVLTRGSLKLTAAKMVMSEDAAGYQFATMYGSAKNPTTFRQKRDGGPDLWIQGRAADRIEYDTKSEVARFFSNARVTLLENGKPTDDVQGEFISYDSKAEFYSVNNTATGASKPGAGRIKVIIQPRNEDQGQ